MSSEIFLTIAEEEAEHLNHLIEELLDLSGIGIKEDKLDKIFDKFYKIEGLEKCTYRGCGLGLAITKSILELHQITWYLV